MRDLSKSSMHEKGEELSGVRGCWRQIDGYPSYPRELEEEAAPMKIGPVDNINPKERDYFVLK